MTTIRNFYIIDIEFHVLQAPRRFAPILATSQNIEFVVAPKKLVQKLNMHLTFGSVFPKF